MESETPRQIPLRLLDDPLDLVQILVLPSSEGLAVHCSGIGESVDDLKGRPTKGLRMVSPFQDQDRPSTAELLREPKHQVCQPAEALIAQVHPPQGVELMGGRSRPRRG